MERDAGGGIGRALVAVVLVIGLLTLGTGGRTADATSHTGSAGDRAVMLLLDGSGSISSAEWQIQLRGFRSAVADQAIVPRDGSVAIGVVQWSSTTRVEVPLTTIRSTADVNGLLDQLSSIPQIGSLTNPGDGVRTGADHLGDNADPAADWTLCLSTDGVTNSGESLASSAAHASGLGVDRLSVIAMEDAGASATSLRNHYEPHLIGDGNFMVARDTPDFAGLAMGCFGDPVRVSALEVTQGLQDWSGSLPLVAGRDTVARAFVETFDGSTQAVTARLHGTRGGQPLPGSPLTPENRNGRVTADGDALDDRGELASSLNFYLDDSWLEGEIELRLELPGGGACDVNAIACPLPSTTHRFEEAEEFGLRMLGVAYERPDGTISIPSLGDLEEQVARARTTMPVPNIDDRYGYLNALGRFNPIEPPRTEADWQRFLAAVELIRSGHGCFGKLCSEYYYALFEGDVPAGEGSATSGYGSTMRSAGSYLLGLEDKYATGPRRNLVGHELGHALGEDHAVHSSVDGSGLFTKDGFCGEEAFALTRDWPDLIDIGAGEMRPAIGPIGHPATETWGFDTRFVRSRRAPALAVVDPNTEFALMSYCSPLQSGGQERWHGQFNWRRLLEHFGAPSTFTTAASAEDPQPGALLVGASDGKGFTIDMAAPLAEVARTEGQFTAIGRDASGAELGRWEFGLESGAADDHGALGPVPFRIGAPNLDPAQLASLEIHREGELLQRLEAPASVPWTDGLSATVADDLVLLDWVTNAPASAMFLVQASWDQGASWQLVGLGDQDGARLVTGLMAGGPASLRVITADGLVATTSETVELVLQESGPRITIDGPEDGAVFVGHQEIRARATAVDAEDGMLGGSSIRWSSDLDGSLGDGRDLQVGAVRLTEGQHVITATAVDSSARSASASFTIVVSRAPTVETTLDPRTRLELLRDEIEASEVDHGVRRSLVAKLTAAIAAIDRDKLHQTCGPIDAFVNELAAQSGKGIRSTESEDWTAKARLASEELSC